MIMCDLYYYELAERIITVELFSRETDRYLSFISKTRVVLHASI